MALSVKVPRKPKALPKRIKFGLPGCPVEQGFMACKRYFQYDVDKKFLTDITKRFIKKEYSKEDAQAILANSEYHFNLYTHIIAGIYWKEIGKEFDENSIKYYRRAKEYYDNLIEPGRRLVNEQTKAEDKATVEVKPNPQELLARKVQSTVMVDLDTLEDAWIAGEKTDIKLYELFKAHDLKGMATPLVKKRLERWLNEYTEAYSKSCPQMVEGYSHIAKTELKRRITIIKTMIGDLDRVKVASKAVRQPRVPKAKAADKQIQRLQFLKESNEHKLMSINPVQIPGSYRLLTFNVKTRLITEYVCSSTSGFEIKGTSLSNFDPELSRSIRLRKPEVFLPIALSKTPKQLDNEWKKLTTKPIEPNGRINKDTILLRVTEK